MPLTKSQFPFSITSKKYSSSSGSTLISESKIAIISPFDFSIASHTALALPFLLCSKTSILLFELFDFISCALLNVLSLDGPQEIIISYSELKSGIREINSSRLPSSFLAGMIIDLEYSTFVLFTD